MALYNPQPPSYDGHTSTLTPYLTLPHLLSLTWLAYPILSLVFVAFRLTSSLDSTQNAIQSAKGDLLASCKAAEEAATSAASMPRYMALATNEQFADAVNSSLSAARQALTLSLTVMEGIINFIIDLYRSIFLCFLELVVRGGLAILIGAVNELNNVVSAVGNGLRDRIQTDLGNFNRLIQGIVDRLNAINPFEDISAPQFDIPNLDALSNIQIPSSFQESLVRLNETIPTVSTIKEKIEDIISTPFELLRKDINDTFATIEFRGSTLPVPEQNKVAFCDKLDMSVVDNIGDDILKAFKIGIVILIVLALVLVGLNCLLTWYKWRCLKNNLEYTRQAWNTDPILIHGKGSISSAPNVTLNDHNLLILHANSSHPLITKITNILLNKFNLSPKHHVNMQWFFNYIFHPPAAACLLIGLFGLLLVEIQLLALGPLVDKYQGQAAETARDFSTLIATSINDNMLSQSRAYALEVNGRVDAIQTTLNDGVFGWVDVTTTQLNTTINEFYDDLQAGVTRVFGNTILQTPASEFIRCLIGSKVDAIENALTFLHDNLNVNMPRVSDNALILSPEAVDEASAPIAAAALGGGAEDDDGGLVGRLVNSYANTLKKERITFAIFLGLWGIVVLMGLLIIFWHSYGRRFLENRKRRRYQREQRENLPAGFVVSPREGAMTPAEGHLVLTKEDSRPWDGGAKESNDLPNFTPLPSPTRRTSFKPFWTMRNEGPAQPAPVVLRNEGNKSAESFGSQEEKVSKLKALRLKVKQSGSAKSDPESQAVGESTGVTGLFGKIKSAFSTKPEPEPTDFWSSYNERPKLKIVVDTPSDKSFSLPEEEPQPKLPSRWSTSPTAPKHDFGWRSALTPSKKARGPLDSPPAPSSTTSSQTATPVRRLPPPPPGLRHKPSVPSDIGASYEDPNVLSSNANAISNPFTASPSDPVPNSLIPGPYPYPVPLHSTYPAASPASDSDPFAAGPPRALVPAGAAQPSPSSAKSHQRVSSVPVWRVTNFSPSDQVSLNSSTASIGEVHKVTTVRTLGVPPPAPATAATAQNPFITPFDDEHRVEIRNGPVRKSMSANPFVNAGTAY